jgi:hypothetical protein
LKQRLFICRTRPNRQAQLGAFLKKDYPLISGILLFASVAVIQSIKTGHLSTGVTWIFGGYFANPQNELQTASGFSDSLRDIPAPASADNALLSDGPGIDGGGTDGDGLPTALQVFSVFGFLALQTYITTAIMNILVLSKIVKAEMFMTANFVTNQVVFFVLLLCAGASIMKAWLLTVSFFTSCVIFVFFVIFMFRQQIQLIGGELGINVVTAGDE